MREILLLIFSNSVSKIGTVLLPPLIVSYIGAQGYGLWDYKISIVLLLDIFITFKIIDGYFRFRSDELYGGNISLFSSTLLFIIVIYGFAILCLILTSSNTILILLCYSFFRVLFSLGVEHERALGGARKYSLLVAVNSIGTLFLYLVTLSFLQVNSDPIDNVTTLILVSISFSLLLVIYLSQSQRWITLIMRSSFKLMKIDLKLLLLFSLPIVPSAAAWWIIKLSSRFFVEKEFGLNELGIYSVHSYLPNIFIMGGLIIYTAIQRYFYKNAKKSRSIQNLLSVVSLFYLFVLTVFLISSKIVYQFLFGLDEIDYVLLGVLLMNSLLFNLASLYALSLTSFYRTKTIMYTTLFAGLIVVVASYLVSNLGSIYIAMSCSLGLLVLLIFRHISVGEFCSPTLLMDLLIAVTLTLIFMFGDYLYMYILFSIMIFLNFKRLRNIFEGKI